MADNSGPGDSSRTQAGTGTRDAGAGPSTVSGGECRSRQSAVDHSDNSPDQALIDAISAHPRVVGACQAAANGVHSRIGPADEVGAR